MNLLYPQLMNQINPDPAACAARAQLLRRAMGYSNQKAFAATCEIDQAAWNKYELGERIITRRDANRVRLRWRVGSDWLWYGDDAGMDWSVREKLLAADDSVF